MSSVFANRGVNIEKLQLIQSVYDSIQPLMQQMKLSDNAIRYLGEFVTASKPSNLNPREQEEKYLYLAGSYQRNIFEDWMGRSLLMVCKSAINKASKKENDPIFAVKISFFQGKSREKRHTAFEVEFL